MSDSIFVCGTGSWSGPKPGDPDNNVLLSAQGTFGGVDVSWSLPAVNPFAVSHVILFRGNDPGYERSVQRAVVSGNMFFDRVDSDEPIQYYYWIQLVSINGTYGEVIGPAAAISRPTIEDTIRQLTGKIDQGVLAQTLRTEIDRIPLLQQAITNEASARSTENGAVTTALSVIQATVGDALATIAEEREVRATANDALARAVNTTQTSLGTAIASVETTSAANIKKVGDVVTEIGSLYTAKVNVNGLIGGFGIYNDGTEVEAGFDVDRFWVGRTGANKTKPFIIEDGEVYIDTAVIKILTADKIDTRGLTIKDSEGTVIFSAGNTGLYYPDGAEGGTAVSVTSFVDDALIINADRNNTNADLVFGRTTGGDATLRWNGSRLSCNVPFAPDKLTLSSMVSSIEPTDTFPGLIWIDPST